MGQLIISHQSDMREVALRLYANLRKQLPDTIIKPNVGTLHKNNDEMRGDIFREMLNAQAAIIITSDQWHGDWLNEINNPDVIAMRAAITTQKMIFILRYNGAQPFLNPLPDELQGLTSAMNLEFNDDNLYQRCDILVNYLRPLMGIAQTLNPAATQTGEMRVQYPPNPHYPDSDRIIHKGLLPEAFQHPLDKMATENLKKAQGFDFLVAKFMEFGVERLNHTIFAASSIVVSDKQYPKLNKMLIEAATILDVPIPEMYVIQIDEVNAFTYGYNRPYIVLYSALLDLLNEDEIMAVIAHELGHIKCGHVLYNEMAAMAVPLASGLLGSIPGFGSIIKAGFDMTMQVAILTWKRRSELSADRASLLVMQEALPCISMLATLTGGTHFLKNELSLEDFIQQVNAYDISEESTNIDRFYRVWAMLYQSTHPFPVERARYLNDWVDTIEFDQIMSGNYLRLPPSM